MPRKIEHLNERAIELTKNGKLKKRVEQLTKTHVDISRRAIKQGNTQTAREHLDIALQNLDALTIAEHLDQQDKITS